jgi:hypothetical protein
MDSTRALMVCGDRKASFRLGGQGAQGGPRPEQLVDLTQQRPGPCHALGERVTGPGPAPVLPAVDQVYPPLGLSRPPRHHEDERGQHRQHRVAARCGRPADARLSRPMPPAVPLVRRRHTRPAAPCCAGALDQVGRSCPARHAWLSSVTAWPGWILVGRRVALRWNVRGLLRRRLSGALREQASEEHDEHADPRAAQRP